MAFSQVTISEESLKLTVKSLYEGLECCEKLDVIIEVDSINIAIIQKQDSVISALQKNQFIIQELNTKLVNDNLIKEEALSAMTKRKKRWAKAFVLETITGVVLVTLKMLIK